jgi:4-hydroxybenzoate polyprenyltransferase
MRIIGGGLITDISVSIWLLSFSIFFFLSLAAIKRQIEIVNTKKIKKKNIAGRGYIVEDYKTISIIAVSAGYISILILVLYINSSQVLNLYSFPHVLWGISVVMLFWISRLILNSSKGKIKDDPVAYAIKDKISYLCLFLILCIMLLGNII